MTTRPTSREQWQPILARREEARAAARGMGGADKLHRCVRERDFPSVTLGAMPAGGGGAAAKLDAEAQARAEDEQRAGAYRLANGLAIDEMIDPRELRNALLDGLLPAEARRR